jgi:hypothetical protein
MNMFLVFGVFMLAIGVFLNSIDEKKFRNGNLISCTDKDEEHKWRWNAFNELECGVCYKLAHQPKRDEGDC